MGKSRPLGFTDLRRLVAPYESRWSILNKFAEINHIPIHQIKQYFYKDTITSTDNSEPKFAGMTRWNFNNETTYGSAIISWLTRIAENEMDSHSIESMLRKSEITTLTSAYYLRYCPECLQIGYHCVFSQMYLFSRCPVHDSELMEVCYNCNFPIKYDLNEQQKVAYGCCNCHIKFWNRFYQAGGIQQERIVKLPLKVLHEFNEVCAWLVDLKRCNVLRPAFEAWQTALINKGRPGFFSVPEMYHAWGNLDVHDIPSYLSRLDFPDMTHAKVRYGVSVSGKGELVRKMYECKRVCVGDKVCNSSWASTGKRGRCEYDSSKCLRPIFNSIRKYAFKKLRKLRNVRCLFYGFAGNTYRINESCRGCEWAKAYVLWREYWQIKLKNHHEYWSELFQAFYEIEKPLVAQWVALWVYGLEVLSGLELAMHLVVNRTPSDEFCPCLSYTWAFEQATAGGPVFHYWTKPNQQIVVYRCQRDQ